MNILSIGNSFSEDATHYLHNIAKADAFGLTTVNLNIGGCPLSRHYKNMLDGRCSYAMEFNGEVTGFYVSIKDALLSRDWDYITFQQASFLSHKYDTYQPYLNELSSYVKKYAPKGKQVIHQTWSYEEGSERLCTELGYSSRSDMTADIEKAYAAAVEEINAELIIPCGSLFEKLAGNNVEHLHRDTFHASFGKGRYALALLWYTKLTGRDITVNSFDDFDENISEKDIRIIKECIRSL